MKLVIALTALLISVCTASNPRRLDTVTDVLSFAQHGTPLRIIVDHTKCTVSLPPEIKAHSFGFEVDKGIIGVTPTSTVIEFEYYREVNGTQFKLEGPAARLIQGTLRNTGEATFIFSVMDPTTHFVFTQGLVTCQLSIGLTIYAEYNQGQILFGIPFIVAELIQGHIIYYNLDLAYCKNNMTTTKTFAFGKIKDIRIDAGGDATFTESGVLVDPRAVPIGHVLTVKLTQKEVMTQTVYSYDLNTEEYLSYEQYSCPVSISSGTFYLQ